MIYRVVRKGKEYIVQYSRGHFFKNWGTLSYTTKLEDAKKTCDGWVEYEKRKNEIEVVVYDPQKGINKGE